MRLSAAASVVVAIILGWFVTVGPTPHVSAAQMLRDAIEGQGRYEGWYAMDLWQVEQQAWQLLGTVNGHTGRRLIVLNEDSGEPQFEYVDPPADMLARYSADTGTLRVTTLSLSTVAPPLPTTDGQLLAMSDMADRYTIRRAEKRGLVRIELQKKPLPSDANEQERRSDSHWPVLVTCDLDPQTDLIGMISVQQGEDDGLEPWVRYRYGVEPLAQWGELALPAGAKIDDQRPGAEAKAVLERLAAVRREGLGFDTGIVVSRSGDPTRGSLSEGGSVSLYAERENKWLKLTWNRGQEIDGWPEPTLDDVLSHLVRTPPQLGIVYDGSTCWVRLHEGGVWQRMDVGERARYGRLSHEIWPEVTLPGRGQPDIAVGPDAEHADGVVLEATVMTQWASAPKGQIRPMQKVSLLLLNDMGPMPLRKTIEVFGEDGAVRRREQWDYSLTDVAMYRDPVRVPLRWRKTRDLPADLAQSEFYRLIPWPGVTLDAKWFADPTVRWPSTGE
jgi:hypothetical protein